MLKLVETARTMWVPATVLSLVAIGVAEYHLAHIHLGSVNLLRNRIEDYILAVLIVSCTTLILHQLRAPGAPLTPQPAAVHSAPRRPEERRAHHRYPINAPSALTIFPTLREIPIVIVDIGAGGMCAATTDELPPSTLVQLERQNSLYLGEVCYCNPADYGYTIGIRFEHVLNQTQTETLLQHLTKRGVLNRA